MRLHLDQVITKLRLHGFADIAHLEGERRLLKLGYHAAFREGTKVSTVRSGTGVVGLGLRLGREVAACNKLRPDVLGLGQSLGVAEIFLIRPQRHLRARESDQYVPRL